MECTYAFIITLYRNEINANKVYNQIEYGKKYDRMQKFNFKNMTSNICIPTTRQPIILRYHTNTV